jgi:hypothetical protein
VDFPNDRFAVDLEQFPIGRYAASFWLRVSWLFWEVSNGAFAVEFWEFPTVTLDRDVCSPRTCQGKDCSIFLRTEALSSKSDLHSNVTLRTGSQMNKSNATSRFLGRPLKILLYIYCSTYYWIIIQMNMACIDSSFFLTRDAYRETQERSYLVIKSPTPSLEKRNTPNSHKYIVSVTFSN